MPRLTKEQLKAISYISMADYANKLDQIEDFDDKLEFTARYLLSHGAKGQKTDYSLEEAIHLARAKLVDTSRKLRDKLYNDEEGPDPADLYIDSYEAAVNPYAEDVKDDIENQYFMANPAQFLKKKAEEYAKEVEDKDIEIEGENAFKENCIRLSKKLDSQLSRQILTAEHKGNIHLDIKARMEASYRGRKNLEKAENMIKPSFFTRTFGTRSVAGKNFDEVYAAFNNPKHALYGNLDALEKATKEYVDYKFAHKSKAEQLAGLAVKEPKEGFACTLLEAIRQQKQNSEDFKMIVGEAVKKDLTEEKVDQIKGPAPEEAQHRVQIVLDLGDDEASDLDSSMEEEPQLQNEAEMEQQAPAA